MPQYDNELVVALEFRPEDIMYGYSDFRQRKTELSHFMNIHTSLPNSLSGTSQNKVPVLNFHVAFFNCFQ